MKTVTQLNELEYKLKRQALLGKYGNCRSYSVPKESRSDEVLKRICSTSNHVICRDNKWIYGGKTLSFYIMRKAKMVVEDDGKSLMIVMPKKVNKPFKMRLIANLMGLNKAIRVVLDKSIFSIHDLEVLCYAWESYSRNRQGSKITFSKYFKNNKLIIDESIP